MELKETHVGRHAPSWCRAAFLLLVSAAGCGGCDRDRPAADGGPLPAQPHPASAPWNALERCLVGEPIVDPARAVSRLREIELALRERVASDPARPSELPALPAGGWPAPCAAHALELRDALGAAQHGEEADAAARMGEAFARGALPAPDDARTVWRFAQAALDRTVETVEVEPPPPTPPVFWRETLALPGYDNGFQRVESMARAGRDVVAVVNASLLCRFEADGERALARMRCDPAAGPVDHIVDDLLDAQPGAPVVVFRQGAGYYDQATGKKLLASDATGPVWGVSYPNGALAVIESGTRLRLLSPDGREEATELGTDSVELVGEWLVRVHQRPGGVALVARRVDGVPAAPVELLTAAIGHLGGSCVSGETLYVSYTVWSAGYDNPRNGLLIHRGTWFPPVPLGNSESMWNCSPEGAIVAVPAIRTDEPRPAGNGPYRSGFRRCTETGCDEPQRSGVYWLRGDPPLRFQGARHIPLRELHALLYYCKPSCGLRVRLAPLGRIDRTPDHVVMNTDAAFEGFEPYVISGLHSRDGQAAIMLVQTAERILALRIDASGELSALRPSP